MHLMGRKGIAMKHINIVIAAAVVLFAGCATLGDGQNSPSAKLRWPVSTVPWENALGRIDSAEVVILCLVDSYDPSKLKISGRHGGPWLFRPRRHNITPAQVLESYLRGVRSLEKEGMMTPSGDADSKKMAIFIVESGDQTRKRAAELFTKLGKRYYDNSIPVIFVFHNKQMITSYTYTRNPGNKGTKLRKVVSDLFTTK